MPKYIDILVALGLLIISGLGAVASYDQILKSEAPQNILFEYELKEGTQNFQLIHNNLCLGFLETNFNAEAPAYILNQANINFGLQGKQINAKLQSALYFNSLGQLVSSETEIKTLDGSITASTHDTNPIKFNFKIGFRDQFADFQYEIPGPLTLVKTNAGSYAFDYAPGISQSLPLDLKKVEKFKQSIEVQAQPTIEHRECQDALNLDLFFNLMLDELKIVQNLIPFMRQR